VIGNTVTEHDLLKIRWDVAAMSQGKARQGKRDKIVLTQEDKILFPCLAARTNPSVYLLPGSSSSYIRSQDQTNKQKQTNQGIEQSLIYHNNVNERGVTELLTDHAQPNRRTDKLISEGFEKESFHHTPTNSPSPTIVCKVL
jgi:hypothetical protein